MGGIIKSASAGTLESSDAFVEIFPAEELSVEISSIVMERFGEAIEKAVREQLSECGVAAARVRVADRGLVDDVHLNLLGGELDERIGQRLDGAVHVALHNDIELLEVADGTAAGYIVEGENLGSTGAAA